MNYGIDLFNDQGENIAHIAIQHNNVEALAEVLKHCPSKLQESDDNGIYPHQLAMKNGNVEITDVIFKQSDKPANKSIIHDAVLSKNTVLLQMAIKRYPTFINSVTKDQKTPIMLSLAVGFHKGTILLLQHGAEFQHEADLTVKTISGQTIIHAAVKNKNIKVLVMILERCSHLINEADNNGLIPLAMPESVESFEIAEILIEYGADIKWKSSRKETVLHLSILAKNQRLVAYLIELDPESISAECDDGSTPLHYSLRQNCVETRELIFSILKENEHLCCYIMEKYGFELIALFIGTRQSDISKRLLSSLTFTLDSFAKFMTTSLSTQNDAVFYYLVQCVDKATYSRISQNDKATHLFEAILHGTTDILDVLLSWNDIYDIVDSDGNTLLHAAVQRQSLEMVQLVNSIAQHLKYRMKREGQNTCLLKVLYCRI